MPAFDETGPMGMGPRTGRGFGPCVLGFGWRRKGFGRYFGWTWPQTKQDKLQALKDYSEALSKELKDVGKELEDLEKEE